MELHRHYFISQQLPAAHYNLSHLEPPTQAGQTLLIAIELWQQLLIEFESVQT